MKNRAGDSSEPSSMPLANARGSQDFILSRDREGAGHRARALLLSAEAPYPLTGGGALRSASLLHFLAQQYDVDVITFREPRAADPAEAIPPGLVRRLSVIGLPANARHMLARAMRNTGRLARGVPPLMDRFAGFSAEIARAVRGRRYELAVIEHFWCAPYLEQLADVSDVTVLNLHNVESVLHERCARFERGAQAIAHRAFQKFCRTEEQKWLPRFTYLLAASDADADVLLNISPASTILVYPNAIPFVTQPLKEHENVIVFSGNLEYHPNISAVRFFHAEIWPALRERWPGLVWRLIGKNPGAVARIIRGDDRIEVTGPVDDAISELARGRVAAVPVLAGSGTRVKILEAWAAGLPVVSTPLGAEGLPVCDGTHLLLAENAVSFQRAVSRLLADTELCERIGRAGRSLYESCFIWEAAWKKLHFLYPATMESSDALRH